MADETAGMAILAEFDGHRWLLTCDAMEGVYYHGRTYAEALGKLVWSMRQRFKLSVKAFGLGGVQTEPFVSRATAAEVEYMLGNIKEGRHRNRGRLKPQED